jgi:hypothetical protein
MPVVLNKGLNNNEELVGKQCPLFGRRAQTTTGNNAHCLEKQRPLFGKQRPLSGQQCPLFGETTPIVWENNAHCFELGGATMDLVNCTYRPDWGIYRQVRGCFCRKALD